MESGPGRVFYRYFFFQFFMGVHRFYRVSMAVFMWLLEGFLGFIGFFTEFYRVVIGF